MVHLVHSQVALPRQEAAPAAGGAQALFEPALLMAMLAPAPGSSIFAPMGPADRAVDALAGGPARRSASAHWAQEAMARATGQQFGVDLAEMASDELAAPSDTAVRTSAAPRDHQAAPARSEQPGAAPQRAAEGRPRPPGGDTAQDTSSQSRPGAGSTRAPAASPAAHAPGAAGAAGRVGASGGAPAAVGAQPGALTNAGSGAAPPAGAAMRIETVQRSTQMRAAAPAPPAHRMVQTQIERGLGAVLRQGGGSLTLQLKPATLGELRIQMTMEQGAVHARFEASSTEARDLILANLGALKAALESRGLRVETLDVTAHDAPDRPVAAPARTVDAPDAPPQHQHATSGDRQDQPSGHESADHSAPEHDTHEAPEDSAPLPSADDASETLVLLRLDTIA